MICTHDLQFHWTFRDNGNGTGAVILQQVQY